VTAFVIYAAGPGTRMGRYAGLHKALLPVGQKAILSHLYGLAPPGARIIVCTGHQARELRDYTELAHPGVAVQFVDVPGWDQPGGGPGASILAARNLAGADDLVVAPCDAYWKPNPHLWDRGGSWAGIAPLPAGTKPADWFMIGEHVFTGVARIAADRLAAYWQALGSADFVAGELRDTDGLLAIAHGALLPVECLPGWTCAGTEALYEAAAVMHDGYDWSKSGEATWVLPGTGRVVKWSADPALLARKADRQAAIAAATPSLAGRRANMAAWEYAPGVTGYEAAEADPDVVPWILDWAERILWKPVAAVGAPVVADWFYREKTWRRVARLPDELAALAAPLLRRINWTALAAGCEPVTFHGDFNLGNIIVASDGGLTAVDWRDSFGITYDTWGDKRYDLGKFAAGLAVHWGRARAGDFSPWEAGYDLAAKMGGLDDATLIIGALSLLNSAPLHRPPLDRILTERGVALLEELC
jgi:hypothetical protein